MRIALFVAVSTLGLVAARPHATACDRAGTPLEKPVTGLAVADVVVVAEVMSIAKRDAKIKVTDVVKGTVRIGDVLDLHGVVDESVLERCDGNPMGAGKRYVLSLWKPAGAVKAYGLVDPFGGVALHSAALEKVWRAELAKQHPHSAWQVSHSGLATQLSVSADAPTNKGDVDLFVVLRNTNAKAITLDLKSWPRTSMSHCKLDIVNAGTRQKIAAKDVPIAKADIAKYFTKNPRKFKTTIEPGGTWIVTLQRITTAAAGWGYKEDLGFVFYPVAAAGDHTVAATCWNFVGRNSKIGTGSITLPLSL